MNKIALADKFMFVGHCEYQPRSYHSRNYIRGSHKMTDCRLMLSVPVRRGISINETVPLPSLGWREGHLASMQCTYSARPYFKHYFPEIRQALLAGYKSLSDLNISLIHVLMHMLEIDTPTCRSEDFGIELFYGKPTMMLAQMCERLGARQYLSSPGEVAYVKKEQMNGFGHSFQQFTHPTYRQGRHGNTRFVPNLSVIDLLFNVGPEAAKIVREAGHI